MTSTARHRGSPSADAAHTEPVDDDPQHRVWRSEGLRFLELFALCGLVIAQPLLSRYGDAGPGFMARGFTMASAAELGVALVVIPPVVVWMVTLPGRAVSTRFESAVHRTFLGLLAGIWIFLLVRGVGAIIAAGAGAVAAIAFTWAHPLFSWLRTWTRWLSVAPILFLAVFLFGSDTSAVLAAGSGSKAEITDVPFDDPRPVVLLIFDELPTASLLDDQGDLDDDHFPNFARLADASTWYPNFSTVSAMTMSAVPAILAGTYPQPDQSATLSQYPISLFTVLGGKYTIRGGETLTHLCPSDLCHSATSGRGPVESLDMAVRNWLGLLGGSTSETDDGDAFADIAIDARFHDPEKELQFADALADYSRGSELFVHHSLLPHGPWEYSGGGLRYENPNPDGTVGTLATLWRNDYAAFSGRQRHLEQLRYVDTWLGYYIDSMQASGLWDEAVIVVLADHGASFEVGTSLRGATATNAWQTNWAPLFIRAPSLGTGVTDMRDVTSVDVLPTILDLLGVPPGLPLDGVSAVRQPAALQPVRFILDTELSSSQNADTGYGQVDAGENLARLFATRSFGSGDDDLQWWRTGTFADVVGLAATDLPARLDDGLEVNFIGTEPTFDVHNGDLSAPLLVSGTTNWDGELAVVLNGTIVAVVPGNNRTSFYTLLPHSRIIEGTNTIEVFGVADGDGGPTLLRRSNDGS